jgi:hypothetical protein
LSKLALENKAAFERHKSLFDPLNLEEREEKDQENEWHSFKSPLAFVAFNFKDYLEFAIQTKINNTYEEAGKILCDLVFSMAQMKKPENEINQKTIMDSLKHLKKRTKENIISRKVPPNPNTRPALQEVLDFAAELGTEHAEYWYDLVTKSRWHDNKGYPIRNWKKTYISFEAHFNEGIK